MGFGLGLNLLLLMAMVATNILSLYHLSSSQQHRSPPPPPVPDHLLHQLSTIRATISHLTRLRSTTTSSSNSAHPPPPIPPDLLLYTRLSPIASACRDHPDLLHRFMNYTPFSLCPSDHSLADSLILRGCHPLPRRRCFSPTPPKPPSSLPTSPSPPPSRIPPSSGPPTPARASPASPASTTIWVSISRSNQPDSSPQNPILISQSPNCSTLPRIPPPFSASPSTWAAAPAPSPPE
ncbi:putative S-adenosyl-L-methionine-dependent methyltransferase [Cinnamomum micranthum f. kanehirae]|uniref:Putative S-adenosyl-L-methionine-dependent methyltransferase n=1 Tax=Cinnamomum micranthum f. kanehirae TaxID=337451 RepID=A0A443PE55_9MAGN|nr:putative S-adenosyl-L-methionine-dependent methyltransferase [Cinnamomum micranthum f. kanehirae]